MQDFNLDECQILWNLIIEELEERGIYESDWAPSYYPYRIDVSGFAPAGIRYFNIFVDYDPVLKPDIFLCFHFRDFRIENWIGLDELGDPLLASRLVDSLIESANNTCTGTII